MESRRPADRRRARALSEIAAIALFHPDVRPRGRAKEAQSIEELSAAERARVAAALDGAAGDRKPCDPSGLAEIEACAGVHPGNALAAMIPPSTVWELEPAREAMELAARGDRYRAIASIGFARFDSCAARLRERVAWLERQLPFASYPRATAVLRAGCDLFAARDGFDAELGCALLEGYVRLLERGSPTIYLTPQDGTLS